MVTEIMGGYGANLIIAIAAVAIALFLLFFVSRMLKNRGMVGRMRPGAGPRLAVLDSTPVDTSRRLVLIRRDDVEHLILIGGPSDLVIESRIEKKREAPTGIVPASEPRQRQPAAPAATAVMQRETPVTAAPARPSVAEPAPKDIELRQTTPASRPAEAVRTSQPPVEGPSTWSASPDSAAAANEAGRNIEDVLDDARGRVFGPASGNQPLAAQASPHEEPLARPNDEPKLTARFEDFLDNEIAGDLSAVTPGETKPPHADAAPRAEPTKRGTSSIDTDMARLLGELSSKR